MTVPPYHAELLELAEDLTHEKWGTFEVGNSREERALCRYLRSAALALAAAVRESSSEGQ